MRVQSAVTCLSLRGLRLLVEAFANTCLSLRGLGQLLKCEEGKECMASGYRV